MCVQRRTHRGGGKKYRQQQFKPGEGWGSFHQSRRGLRADTHTHTVLGLLRRHLIQASGPGP